MSVGFYKGGEELQASAEKDHYLGKDDTPSEGDEACSECASEEARDLSCNFQADLERSEETCGFWHRNPWSCARWLGISARPCSAHWRRRARAR